MQAGRVGRRVRLGKEPVNGGGGDGSEGPGSKDAAEGVRGAKRPGSLASAADASLTAAQDMCIICCEDLTTYYLGVCNHRAVCADCGLRQRLLYKETKCAVCKTDLPEALFVKDRVTVFASIPRGRLVYLKKHRCYFEEPKLAERIRHAWDAKCSKCGKVCNSMAELKRHARTVHSGSVFCDVCLEHRKAWLCEQQMFSSTKELREHQDKGVEGDALGGSFAGHPFCQFCRRHFFDDDMLWDHLRKNHESCYLCQRAGIHHQYYAGYPQLELHFDREHFLCRDPDCRAQGFVVFKDELELKAHQVQVHKAGTSQRGRRGRNAAATIDVAFNVRRADRSGAGTDDNGELVMAPGRRRRELRGGGGGGGARSNSQPPENASRPDFVAISERARAGAHSQRSSPRANLDEVEVTPSATPVSAATVHPSTPLSTLLPPGPPPGLHGPPSALPPPPPGLRTNAAGAAVSAPPGLTPPPGTQRDSSLKQRNAALVASMKRALAGDEAAFRRFRQFSAEYRAGEITPMTYYARFLDLFGSAGSDLFTELVDLLPEQAKQAELRAVQREHNAALAAAAKEAAPPPAAAPARRAPAAYAPPGTAAATPYRLPGAGSSAAAAAAARPYTRDRVALHDDAAFPTLGGAPARTPVQSGATWGTTLGGALPSRDEAFPALPTVEAPRRAPPGAIGSGGRGGRGQSMRGGFLYQPPQPNVWAGERDTAAAIEASAIRQGKGKKTKKILLTNGF